MSAAELLAKLTPHVRQIDGVGFGGIDRLPADTISGAMAGLPREAYLLLLAKYCDDKKASSELWDRVTARILSEKKCDEDRARDVALAVLWPAIWHMRCSPCNGTGLVAYIHPCKKCKGTGMGELSERKLAAMANVPQSTWRECWQEYARGLGAWLNEMESYGLGHINRQLREDS